ncbi:hypothetical protein [Fundicoccus culcitae]|uniref:DNA polymerase III subunit delta n=1 Tax=Fundicoccus culcitae TaxID=2969821 RepID=A0ABY5P337_9LACT|nr:hypothetical protein [Fundicoccus culcitae]UUX33144.1 hypothetical protein NRE15_09540 [Fundicoccus culcitae]
MQASVDQIKQHVNELIASNQLAHAYAFTGEAFDQKVAVTTYLVQGLACPHFDEEGQPCQACSFCERISKQQYTDLFVLEPDGQTTRVDQIRQLKDWLSKSPVESDFKVAVISRAETMNPSAANALLKFLEEPLDNIYIILYTNAIDLLLPTIQSRVQVWHFAKAENEERLNRLLEANIRPRHAHIIVQLATDALDRWIEGYQEESFDQWIKGLNYFYQMLIERQPQAFIVVQTHLKSFLSNQQAQDGLDYLMLLNHHLLKKQTTAHADEARTAYAWLDDLIQSKQPSTQSVLELNQALLTAKQQVMANVSGQLAYEGIAVSQCDWK